MKTFYRLITLLIILSGCSQSSYDYELENRIIDSFYTYYNQEGIDIKKTVNKIESVIIKYNIIEDKSGKSYIKKIKQISKENDFNLKNPELLNAIDLIGYIPPNFSIPNMKMSEIDSIKLQNSKIQYLTGIYDSIKVKGNVSPQIVADEILEVFDAYDFDNQLYKTVGLIYTANLIKIQNIEIHKRKLPALNEDGFKTNTHNTLNVKAIKDNIIVVNGKENTLKNLKDIAKQFILETSDKIEVELPLIGKQNKSKGIIEIEYNDNSSFDLYISVQDSLVSAFNEIRNDYSLKLFRQPFDKLENNKAEIIIDLIPLSITEAIPRGLKR